MTDIEKSFDINETLLNLFSSLKHLIDKNKIELIYEMSSTVPKELRGNSKLLLSTLTKILSFVIKNSHEEEILLSLSAPEDFVYEEPISFQIKHTGINRKILSSYIDINLQKEIQELDGEIHSNDESDIDISIPFKNRELGFRRHYRLPNKTMTGKKVLIVCKSKNMTDSIKNLFQYFLYDVDIGFYNLQKNGGNLSQYDILITENDSLSTQEFIYIIENNRDTKPLNCVILQDTEALDERTPDSISQNLIKPITQDSIFKLILSLFDNKEIAKAPIVNNSDSLNSCSIVKNSKNSYVATLDEEIGRKNTKAKDLTYDKELKYFLADFNNSDKHFRELTQSKSIDELKDFALTLETQSRLIGAESMVRFTELLNLILVYNKVDMLPIYPGRYRIELKKLTDEIKSYLHIK